MNREQRRAVTKVKVAAKTYIIDKHLTGELAGAHIVMGGMTGRDVIRLQSGDMSESEAMEFTAAKVLEHNLDADDVLDLDYSVLLTISEAWRNAIKDAAVPPEPGSD